MTKAFDKVNHYALYLKLMMRQVPYVQDILLPTDSFASVSGMLFFVFLALPGFSFSLYMYYSDLHCTV